MRSQITGTGLTLLTWCVVLLMIFPVLWMIFTSLKSENAAATNPPSILTSLSFDQFTQVFDMGIAPFLINSAVVSIGSTIVAMLLAIPAAYALSVRRIRKWKDVLFFFISLKFMPAAASIIPLYLLLKTLGLLDNVSALSAIYVAMNLPIAVWMMRSFFSEVPFEILEAAQVDGAGYWRELVRVAIPIVLPGIAAASLICFIFAWNEYFFASLLTSSAARTAPTFLASMVDARGQFLAVLSAAATIAVLPVVSAGWIAQKQLVRGLAMGAVK